MDLLPKGRVLRAFGASIAVAIAVAAPVRASELDDAWTYTRKATRALLHGEAEVAERLYHMGLERVAGFPPAELGLGHVAMARGDYDAALLRYVAARRGYAKPSVALGTIEAERRQDARDAIDRLKTQREHALRKLDEIEAAGGGGATEKERTAKLQAVVRARELQVAQLDAVAAKGGSAGVPADVEFHLGNALFKLGRLREAVEAWEASVASNPDFGLVHRNLAVAYVEMDRMEQARESLAAADRLGAAVPPALRQRLSAPEGAATP